MLTQISAALTSATSVESTARPTWAATLRTPGMARRSFITEEVTRFIAGSEVPDAPCNSTTTSVSLKLGISKRSVSDQTQTPMTTPTPANSNVAIGLPSAPRTKRPKPSCSELITRDSPRWVKGALASNNSASTGVKVSATARDASTAAMYDHISG